MPMVVINRLCMEPPAIEHDPLLGFLMCIKSFTLQFVAFLVYERCPLSIIHQSFIRLWLTWMRTKFDEIRPVKLPTDELTTKLCSQTASWSFSKKIMRNQASKNQPQSSTINLWTRWWFQICLIHPYLGKWFPFWLAHIFQMGWFNHQLDKLFAFNTVTFFHRSDSVAPKVFAFDHRNTGRSTIKDPDKWVDGLKPC